MQRYISRSVLSLFKKTIFGFELCFSDNGHWSDPNVRTHHLYGSPNCKCESINHSCRSRIFIIVYLIPSLLVDIYKWILPPPGLVNVSLQYTIFDISYSGVRPIIQGTLTTAIISYIILTLQMIEIYIFWESIVTVNANGRLVDSDRQTLSPSTFLRSAWGHRIHIDICIKCTFHDYTLKIIKTKVWINSSILKVIREWI